MTTLGTGEVSATERIYRARRIGMTFGRVYVGIKANQFIARRLRPPDMRLRWSRFNQTSAESIYEAAIELRGLILKGCQFLGARADVLPREYVEVLSRLQDRVPPKSFAVVRSVVEQELGQPLEAIFESFSPEPIASASLAQVHEAHLKGGGRVAVKVQYPEIAALVRSDLANLRSLFRAVGYLEREVDLMPLVDELAIHVPRELDFMEEGRNAERVAAIFAKRDDILVPGILWEHTTRRVLVMEFMDGLKITDTEALGRAGVDTDQVARILAEAYCEQVLVHGFFHADPHPGNLLVQPEGPRLVLLDFGLSKDLPPHFRESVLGVVAKLLQGDADGVAAALLALGFETRDGTPDGLAQVTRVILEAGERLRHDPQAGPELVARLREELPELIRRNPVIRVPSHVVLLGRAIGLLSGVSRSLDARLDLLGILLPYTFGTR